MRNKILFSLSLIGFLAGLVSAYVFGIQKPPMPPTFIPATNPFEKGIYVNGIIESDQPNGENINLYPEVSGTIRQIFVAEGERVRAGTALLKLDDSVQKATVEQQKSQAEAALTVLEELKAEPRKENLEIAGAQADLARANLKSSKDSLDKQKASYELDPNSVSKDTLDTAWNAVKVAQANLEVAEKQLELVKAGAWSYDIRNQEKQYEALSKAFLASSALLAKYVISAPTDGLVLSINAAVGSYVSAQGAYETYSQGFNPVMVMGSAAEHLAVRCYVDEILIHRLPQGSEISARMFIRGTDVNIPLEYVRKQPYVSPKIELSNQRTERVDVRVLPLIFRFPKSKGRDLYPGQLVDVYIAEPGTR